jgi:hypothetical protein
VELRCDSKKHAELVIPTADEGLVEFRCASRWCGAMSGVIVLHRFSTSSGKLVQTNRYQQPPIKEGRVGDAT